jgi:hypothetical protein
MADPCKSIRDQITEKNDELKTLQKGVSGGDDGGSKAPSKSGVGVKIIELRRDIKALGQKLKACEQGYVRPGTLKCDDGGLYYIRKVGKKFFWFGEHKDGNFANVFFGEQAGGEISGRWFDVPKGRAKSSGNIRVSVDAAYTSMKRISASGGFGGSKWEAHKPFVNPGLFADWVFRKAGFEGSGDKDLTGTWMCNDGGTYYVRHVGNEIAWFGESSSFSNVFLGTLKNGTITGDWADVPKRSILQSGTLTLKLEAGDTLKRTAVTGGFGGSEWHRVEALNVNVNLSKLTLHETEDTHGDEPFLWTVFFKLDGDTVNFQSKSISFLPTVSSTSGSHRNITSETNVGSGRTLNIPSWVGKYSTVLKTIRGFDPSLVRDATMFGLLVVAWDEDGFTDAAIEAGRLALVKNFGPGLDALIQPHFGEILFAAAAGNKQALTDILTQIQKDLRDNLAAAAKKAIEAAEHEWSKIVFEGGQDDKLGLELKTFSFKELLAAKGSIPLDLRFKDDEAHYQVKGSLSVN